MSFHLPALPFHDAGLVFAVVAAAILVSPLLARVTRLPTVVITVLLGFAVGPTGFGLLERVGVVATLGMVGLLYLMFVAGLELDLDDFVENRRDSIGFGALTFIVPMGLGIPSALALGYEPLAAVLLASCWASHTLLSYPIFQKSGTVGNRAVATTVGATIVTDTAALLVLAVVARAHQGALTPVFWMTLLPSLGLLVFGSVWGLPRLTKHFFSGAGQDREMRFLFVMVSLFVIASLAEVIGIEAIVGAFLAGLALNRSVPNGGALMERIEFLGNVLFIPFFLLATGMLIDIAVLSDRSTLLAGAVFSGVALLSKYLAASASGRLFNYRGAEVGAMFSLSSAQAAATLAAVVVGLDVGLFDTETVNAVVMVILVTCVVSSAAGSRYAARLPRPESDRDFGDVVAVPVANPETAPWLMRVASTFARADGGIVVPVLVAPSESNTARLRELHQLEVRTLAIAQSAGAEARAVMRIDTTPQLGILHTLVEQQASLLVIGWKGGSRRVEARFGGILDDVLDRTLVPTLVVLEGLKPPTRAVVTVDAELMTPRGWVAFELALQAGRNVARDLGIPLVVVANRTNSRVAERVRELTGVGMDVDQERLPSLLSRNTTPSDLVVIPSLGDEGHLRTLAGRTLRAIPGGASIILAVAELAPVEVPALDNGNNDTDAVAPAEAGGDAARG